MEKQTTMKTTDLSYRIQVMTTQTWSYFHSQLDRVKKIKVHILTEDGIRSYCGLVNHDDVGEMSFAEYLHLHFDMCLKCERSYLNGIR